MQMKFEPSACRAKEVNGVTELAMFSGTVTLKVPNFDERYQFIEDCGVNVADSGGVEKKSSNFSILRSMVKNSEKFYISVELKKLSTGAEYNSFESLTYDPDCDSILMEVASEIRGGFRPSKN
jgi:hypothetical protein